MQLNMPSEVHLEPGVCSPETVETPVPDAVGPDAVVEGVLEAMGVAAAADERGTVEKPEAEAEAEADAEGMMVREMAEETLVAIEDAIGVVAEAA